MSSDSSSGVSSDVTEIKLTPYEALRFGDFGAKMEAHHSYMKYEYQNIYDLADGDFNKRGMTLNTFLRTVLGFREELHAHHSFEERAVFPLLAKRMPSFADDEKHRTSHKVIHDGLDSLVSLVTKFRADQTSYSPVELRACLDSFREVLMRHLDEEVQDLRAENMAKYWALEEVERFPW